MIQRRAADLGVRFFRKPITLTLGISGQARMVNGASISFGTRITGD